METQLPIDLSGFSATVGKILTILGHTPEEIEKHTKTFVQTALILTMEKAFSTLPQEKQDSLQKEITSVDPASPEQPAKVLTIINENIPADQLKTIFDDVAQKLMTQYFVSVQPKMTPEQLQAVRKMLTE